VEARTCEGRAASLLESIKPELLKLLGGAPSFGSVGLDLVFHAGEIARIVFRTEVSGKPRDTGTTTKLPS
jgi:hypothetical protein